MLVRHVMNLERPKIRQPRFRAHRRELRIIDNDFVSRKLVGPGLNLRKLGVKAGSRVLRRVTRRFRHVCYCSGTTRRDVACYVSARGATRPTDGLRTASSCSREPSPRIKGSTVAGALVCTVAASGMVNYCLQKFLPHPERQQVGVE